MGRDDGNLIVALWVSMISSFLNCTESVGERLGRSASDRAGLKAKAFPGGLGVHHVEV